MLLAVAVGVLAVNLYNRESAESKDGQTVVDNIMTRTSIRSYTDKAVDAATVETLLRAGMAAPTAKINSRGISWWCATGRCFSRLLIVCPTHG